MHADPVDGMHAGVRRAQGLPARAGIGLRAPHYREILETRPDIGWVEVHSENYFGDGGQPLHYLERIRSLYPLSLHGVGLALGSTAPLDLAHVAKLARLIDRFEPGLVSDHLCWAAAGGRHANDLLPMPYTEEALDHVCARIAEVQERLGRRILVENVSSYLRFAQSTVPEWEFLARTARRTGCGILLDVNNVYVSAINHGFDPHVYLAAVPMDLVGEIHLAGYDLAGGILVDTHGKPVYDPVWALYRDVVERSGPRPTLIEWDTDLPALPVLLAECRKAAEILHEPALTRPLAG